MLKLSFFLFLFSLQLFFGAGSQLLADDGLHQEDGTSIDTQLVEIQAYIFEPDTVEILLDKCQKQLALEGTPSQWGKYYFLQAKHLFNKREYQESFFATERSVSYYQEAGDRSALAFSYLELANYFYNNLNDFDQAFFYGLKAKTLFESVSDTLGMGASYNLIGVLQLGVNDYPAALVEYKNLLELSKNESNPTFLFAYHTNLAVVYSKMEAYEEAIQYATKALSYTPSVQYTADALALKVGMGIHYAKLAEADKAKLLIKEVEAVMPQQDLELFFFGKTYFKLGEYYELIQDYAKASSYYQKAYEQFVQHHKTNRLFKLLKKMAHIAHQTKDFDTSHQLYERAYELEDSLKTIIDNNRFAHWQSVHELEKKNKEIDQLHESNDLKDATIKSKSFQLWLIFVCFLLVLLLLIFKIREKKRLAAHQEFVWKRHKELEKNRWELKEAYRQLTEEKNTNEKSSEQKYTESSLSEKKRVAIEEKLAQLFHEEKLYLDAEMNIEKLSHILQENRSYTSQVINEKYQKTFKQLLNTYRVEEACKLLSDHQHQNYTLDYIAQQSGFKSTSTFYKVFKEQIGLTPSFYRTKAQQETIG